MTNPLLEFVVYLFFGRLTLPETNAPENRSSNHPFRWFSPSTLTIDGTIIWPTTDDPKVCSFLGMVSLLKQERFQIFQDWKQWRPIVKYIIWSLQLTSWEFETRQSLLFAGEFSYDLGSTLILTIGRWSWVFVWYQFIRVKSYPVVPCFFQPKKSWFVDSLVGLIWEILAKIIEEVCFRIFIDIAIYPLLYMYICIYYWYMYVLLFTYTHTYIYRQRVLPRMTHSLRLFQFFGGPKLPQKNIGWSSQVPRDNSPLDMKWFTLLSKVVYVAVVKGVCASSVFMKCAHQFSFLSRMLHSNVPRCRLS